MAVPAKLLEQLLALDESQRVEIAHALLESVDRADDAMSPTDRALLHASIERSLDQADAGEAVPLEQVIAALRAKRAARATR